MRRRHPRHSSTRPTPRTLRGAGPVAVVLALAVSGCGSQTVGARGGEPTATATTSTSPMGTVVDLDDEVVAHGMLMQTSPTDEVELCLGAVQTSYPPQCSGPTVVGEVDWGTLEPEEALGQTFSSGDVWAVGRFDPGAGESGALTLTRPLSLTAPEGVIPPPQLTSSRFPRLCDDPYAGGGRPGGGTPDAQNALSERLPSLDGYIGSWVSDGSSMFNVLVTGDAVAARDALRETWKGGLCVEQRGDLPPEVDVRAAQRALSSLPGFQASWGDDSTGVLHLEVVVLDETTRERIVDAVAPWLVEGQVRVASAFQQMPR